MEEEVEAGEEDEAREKRGWLKGVWGASTMDDGGEGASGRAVGQRRREEALVESEMKKRKRERSGTARDARSLVPVPRTSVGSGVSSPRLATTPWAGTDSRACVLYDRRERWNAPIPCSRKPPSSLEQTPGSTRSHGLRILVGSQAGVHAA